MIFGIVAVAVYAFVGGGLVNDDGFVADEFGLHVTLVTSHVGMSAGEGEVGAGVVVEGGRHPALGIVAIGAVSLAILGDKLGIVSVLVASLTLLWRALESRFVIGGGLVAITAGDGAMRADKCELGLGMIEAVDIRPGTSVVAGFAAEGSAIGAFASHAIVELALVRIFVTGGAIAIFEMERKNFVASGQQPPVYGNRRKGRRRERPPMEIAWICVWRW